MTKIKEVDIPELILKVDELRKAHREQWFSTYKPFGWEVIDIRYGGLLARLESASQRLSDYIEKRIDRIEELEEELLYFQGDAPDDKAPLGSCNSYHRIVSASPL